MQSLVLMLNEAVGLPSHKVWKLAGLPPSTLNYWVQIRLVTPSLRKQEGRRVEYWWSVSDAVLVRTIRALRQAGASLQDVRRAKKLLDARGAALSSARLLWDGHEMVIQEADGAITSVRRSGQQLLTFFDAPLGDWYSAASDEAEPVDLQEFRRQAKKRRQKLRARALPSERFLAPASDA